MNPCTAGTHLQPQGNVKKRSRKVAKEPLENRSVLFLTRAHCQASNNQVVSWEALPWPRSPMELPHHHRLVPGRAEDSVGVKGTGDLPGTRQERPVHLPATGRAQHSCVMSKPKMCGNETGESGTFQLDVQLLSCCPALPDPDTGHWGNQPARAQPLQPVLRPGGSVLRNL